MKYTVIENDGIAEIYSNTSNIRIYKIPYSELKDSKVKAFISNRFIVYILSGKHNGQDAVYVGKSVNGVSLRPVSHQNKCDYWRECYVLTQIREGSFLNDGTIQFLENQISNQITEDNYYLNLTKITGSKTANAAEIDDCRDFLSKAYPQLRILGFVIGEKVPSLNCSAAVSKPALNLTIQFWYETKKYTASCVYESGKYILPAGTHIRPQTAPSYKSPYMGLRQQIIQSGGVLDDDLVFHSASAAAGFVTGHPVNGLSAWKTASGLTLHKWFSQNRES